MNKATAQSIALAMVLWRRIRRIFIFIIGMTVILIGIAMIATPGPAILVIPAGLAILATEFVWARWLLKRVKASVHDASQAVRGVGNGSTSEPKNLIKKLWFRSRRAVAAAIAPFRKGYLQHSETSASS